MIRTYRKKSSIKNNFSYFHYNLNCCSWIFHWMFFDKLFSDQNFRFRNRDPLCLKRIKGSFLLWRWKANYDLSFYSEVNLKYWRFFTTFFFSIWTLRAPQWWLFFNYIKLKYNAGLCITLMSNQIRKIYNK